VLKLRAACKRKKVNGKKFIIFLEICGGMVYNINIIGNGKKQKGVCAVKNRIIRMICDKSEGESFWESNIRAGLRYGASKYDDELCVIDEGDISARSISGEYVLVIGGRTSFAERTASLISAASAYPIIVNAGMPPDSASKYSGVVFGLEGIVGECMSLFESCGRKKTVLFGLSRDVVSDSIKRAAFGGSDIVYADGHIEDCADEFVRTLGQSGCDSALCANDTAALCLLRSLADAKISVPEDFAVMGFGNSYVGANLPVPLTSVDFDYRMMGEEAVRLAHILYDDPYPSNITITLPCRLIVRSTTGVQKSAAESKDEKERTQPSRREYFDGDAARDILRCEEIFQQCVQTDREILLALIKGMTAERIAESLLVTDRAVRYRIKKLSAKYGFSSGRELAAFMKRIMYGNITETKGL